MNFAALIALLGADAVFQIINSARPPADYLFATFLPEVNKPGYQAKSGNMTVRTTMAGLVGADSVYPPSGYVETSTFSENVAKIANRVTLSEMDQRELQQLLMIAGNNQQVTQDTLRTTALNFLNKLVVQAHLDAMEYLRGQALVDGELDWTFNKITLEVDYGVPTGNFLADRTGNDGYGGTASKFWTDMRAANSKLKNQVRARLAHPDTIDMIVTNDANRVRIIAQDDVTGTMTMGRLVGTNESLSSDTRDRVTLIGYGMEGEVLDPSTGKTKKVPYLKPGKVLTVGNPIPRGFQVGQGSTDDPQNALPLGYTHIGPTVEGNGRPGRWADLRVPDDAPWSLEGRGVTNGLPVIEAPEKIVVATTEIV